MPSILKIFLLLLAVLPFHANAQERLVVKENLIKTAIGHDIFLRGVSLCSLDWHNPLELIDRIIQKDKWNINILRLPVQAGEWIKVEPEIYISERIDPAVELCRQHKLYCIIDWHDIRSWNDEAGNQILKDFWSRVAPRYAKDKNIIYEIFNEPTAPQEKTLKNWLVWRDTVQPWVDDIRKVAPNTLLLIGSPHWSQMTSFAADHPFEGKNIAYTAHIYPNYKSWEWDGMFGDAAKKIPVFLSEWGWSESEDASDIIRGSTEDYAQPLRTYLDARPHISWTAWSYDPKCGPAMIGSDDEMGRFVKGWLNDVPLD